MTLFLTHRKHSISYVSLFIEMFLHPCLTQLLFSGPHRAWNWMQFNLASEKGGGWDIDQRYNTDPLPDGFSPVKVRQNIKTCLFFRTGAKRSLDKLSYFTLFNPLTKRQLKLCSTSVWVKSMEIHSAFIHPPLTIFLSSHAKHIHQVWEFAF